MTKIPILLKTFFHSELDIKVTRPPWLVESQLNEGNNKTVEMANLNFLCNGKICSIQ